MRFALAFLVAALLPAAAWAQYPAKPVRVVIAFPAGGPVDVLARTLAAKMGASLGQQVVVDNRPGGNTLLAADLASKAPADGYTLFLALDTTMSLVPFLYPKLPFDPLKDFASISQVTTSSTALVVRADSPFKTLGDLVTYAKAHSGKLNIAASAPATQLVTIMLRREAGIEFVHVPYKGSAPQLQALNAGEIDGIVDGYAFYVPPIRQGRMRALFVTGPQRASQLPETQTVREAGYPALEKTSWVGLFAPAGTPRPVIDRLNSEVAKAVSDPETRQRLVELGHNPTSTTPDQMAALLKEEFSKWGPIVKASGLKLEQ
jgi:tripartite-type tricarboxylate transporter receptor subunit TctC